MIQDKNDILLKLLLKLALILTINWPIAQNQLRGLEPNQKTNLIP